MGQVSDTTCEAAHNDAFARLHITASCVRVVIERITKLAAASTTAAATHSTTTVMPLDASTPLLKRTSSLPRQLTFTTDSALQQYQSAMKSVRQYLRAHMSDDQIELLGVNDCRARYYYDEIQQYLAHRVKQEQEQHAHATQPASAPHSKHMSRQDSGLLQDIDAFLDELDPALFDAPSDVAATQSSLPVSNSSLPTSVSRLQHSCSYIKEMQEEARARGRYTPYALKKSRSAMLVD